MPAASQACGLKASIYICARLSGCELVLDARPKKWDPRKKMGAEAPDWLADFKTPRLLCKFCEFFYPFNIE